ncbi:hypothetical protein TNCV_2990241 [Trichonephila clavipes]|nr:hypothetical protein TNCV_2990241 [Trichonephila clavipes]
MTRTSLFYEESCNVRVGCSYVLKEFIRGIIPEAFEEIEKAQWSSGSVLRFHITCPSSIPGPGATNETDMDLHHLARLAHPYSLATKCVAAHALCPVSYSGSLET